MMRWKWIGVVVLGLVACSWSLGQSAKQPLPFADNFDTQSAGSDLIAWRAANKVSALSVVAGPARSQPNSLHLAPSATRWESLALTNQLPFVNPATGGALQKMQVSLAMLPGSTTPEITLSIVTTSYGRVAGSVRFVADGGIEFAHGADGAFVKVGALSPQELGNWIEVVFRIDTQAGEGPEPMVYELTINGRSLGVQPLRTQADTRDFNSFRIVTGRGQDLFVDDVLVTIPGAAAIAPAAAATVHPPSPAQPKEQVRSFGEDFEAVTSRGLERLTNIAGFCSVRGYPFLPLASRRQLVDGDKTTRAPFTRGMNIGGEVHLEFPKPLSVSAIRFHQGVLDPRDRKAPAGFSAICNSYELQGRSPGAESWDVKLATANDTAVGGWNRHDIEPPVTLEAIRFVATKGAGGYMTAYPVMGEFEVYTDATDLRFGTRTLPQARPLDEKWGRCLEQESVAAASSFDLRDRVMRGVTVEPWMFQWNTWDPQKGPLTEHLPFQRMLSQLKEMRINTVWLFPPDGHRVRGDKNPPMLLYPSKVGYGDSINVLTPLSEALHAQGIKLIVMWYANRPPFSIKPWQFPLEDSSRFADKEPFDNVLFGRWFKDKWTALMLEALELGADGVAVLPDEYYHRGPRLPVGKDNVTDRPMVEAFQDRYGYDTSPSAEEDSEKYRAWKLLQYQGLADLTAHFCRAVHEKFPQAYCTTNITITPYSHNAGMEHGVAYDLIGHTARLDGFGTDPYFPSYGEGHWMVPGMMKAMRAAQSPHGRRGVVFVLQANQWWPGDSSMAKFFRPVWSYGALVSAIAHGGMGHAFYRFNYLADGPGYARNTANAHRLIEELEKRGLADAQTPRNVALLASRASVDWYQLRMKQPRAVKASGDKLNVEELTGGSTAVDAADLKRAQVCESIRGQVHEKVVMEQLLRAGRNFDQIYLDHPSDLTVLKDYDAAVVPFAYSIPLESVRAIEKAVKSGMKVLIIRQLGETDPLGEPYEKGPALEQLVKRYPKQVSYWDVDLMQAGDEPQWVQRFQKYVDDSVGEAAPVTFQCDGDVEFAIRMDSAGRMFIFLINWDGRPHQVVLGLNGPDQARSLEQFRFGHGVDLQASSADEVSAEAMRRWSVALEPGEVRVIHVKR